MMTSTHGSMLPPIQSRQQNTRQNNYNDYGYNTTATNNATEHHRMQQSINNLASSSNSKSYSNFFQ